MAHYLLANMNIGKTIAKIRKSNKLTQEETAAKLQLMGMRYTHTRIGLIETGRLNVPLDMLVALKLIFQCEFADFFVGLEEELMENIRRAEDTL